MQRIRTISASRRAGAGLQAGVDGSESLPFEPTEGTTILAVRFKDGVLIAGDRRATAGNAVIYDRADKVIDIDEHSVMAISGSPAIAYEIARILEHSFQYHRRRQLQEMSLEAKLRRLSLLIRDNLPMAIQGIGAVIPIMATYDVVDERGKIFFYDALGAQFEVTDFTTTGSGSSFETISRRFFAVGSSIFPNFFTARRRVDAFSSSESVKRTRSRSSTSNLSICFDASNFCRNSPD